jgi:hypothetical protein
MLVETSFCGPKPIEQTTSDASSVELTADMLENVILARRRDPSEVVLAECVDINLNATEATKTSTKNNNIIKDNPDKDKIDSTAAPSNPNPDSDTKTKPKAPHRKKVLDPEKLKEVRAIKARLNEINARKLAAAQAAQNESKKIVGVTASGTEYIRIKLKPDHLYPDQGLSPNEKMIDESDFKVVGKKKDKSGTDTIHNISSVSSSLPHQSTHHESNRSPSPASISVSRKSSFCSFFKSKDSNINTDQSTKKRSTSATSSTSKGKLDKSPLPSPSKSSNNRSLVFSIFHKYHSSTKSETKSHITHMSYSSQIESTPGESKELLQESTPTSGGKPRLRYYEGGNVVHIPLHTPPEEKELYGSSKTRSKYEAREEQVKQQEKENTASNVPQPPPPPPMRSLVSELEQKLSSKKLKQPPEVQMRPRLAPTAQLEKLQSADEIDDVPAKSTTPVGSNSNNEDGDRDPGASSSLWSVEVQRHDSNDSGVTVISSQNFNSNEDTARNSENSLKNGTIERSTVANVSSSHPISAKGRHKRHLLFSTKIGSGSEEQIFSTQLSLSKTESQSSQLSEQASALGSPKSDEQQQQNQHQHVKPLPPQEITVVKRDQSTETVGRSRSRDSKKSHESGGSASDTKSKRDSIELSKKRDSMEAIKKRDSMEPIKKRDSMEPIKKRSSDESLKKKRDSSEIKGDSQSPHSLTSPVQSLPPHPQPQHTHHGIHRHHSHRLPEPANKMEISSESERESDIDSAAIKRISRSMEDHESTGLVLQESFDDELPYVPTTLPEERSTGLRIVPVKERTQIDLKTIPVERPRSTTPINPASLDNYCERKMSESNESSLIRGEKLRISLPRKKSDTPKEKSQTHQKVLTKRTSNLSNKSWTEFAEQNIQGTTNQTKPSVPEKATKPKHPPFPPDAEEDFPPPALPPRKSLSKSQWIDFENIPEKRQPPKKITTLPSKDGEKNHSGKSSQRVHYNYVAPEECQCECHCERDPDSNKQSPAEHAPGKTPPSEDSQPLLDEAAERKSVMR